MKDTVQLYTVAKDVKCRYCGSKGAVRYEGLYGLIDENDPVYYHQTVGVGKAHLAPPFLTEENRPYECLNCGANGLIGGDEYNPAVMFDRIKR